MDTALTQKWLQVNSSNKQQTSCTGLLIPISALVLSCMWSHTSCHWQWFCSHLLIFVTPVMDFGCIFFLILSQTRRLSLQVYKTNKWQLKRKACHLISEWPALFPCDSPEISVITVWQLCNYMGSPQQTRKVTCLNSCKRWHCHWVLFSECAHEFALICVLASVLTGRLMWYDTSVDSFTWGPPITDILLNWGKDALQHPHDCI